MALTDTGSLQVCKAMNQSRFNGFWGRVIYLWGLAFLFDYLSKRLIWWSYSSREIIECCSVIHWLLARALLVTDLSESFSNPSLYYISAVSFLCEFMVVMCYSGRLWENGFKHDDYILSRWAVSGLCHSPSACLKQASCTVPFPLHRAGRQKDCSCCIFILFDLSRMLFHTHTLKFAFPSVNEILISFYFGSSYHCTKAVPSLSHCLQCGSWNTTWQLEKGSLR